MIAMWYEAATGDLVWFLDGTTTISTGEVSWTPDTFDWTSAVEDFLCLGSHVTNGNLNGARRPMVVWGAGINIGPSAVPSVAQLNQLYTSLVYG